MSGGLPNGSASLTPEVYKRDHQFLSRLAELNVPNRRQNKAEDLTRSRVQHFNG
jgi:hypothetical protein